MAGIFEMDPATQDDSIKLLSLQDSSIRTVRSHPPGFQDRYPIFSPIGNSLAFVRSSGPYFVDELYLVSVDGSNSRRLTSDSHRIFGPPAITPDVREIVFPPLAPDWKPYGVFQFMVEIHSRFPGGSDVPPENSAS
jgi:Tol biopolymer transport system component